MVFYAQQKVETTRNNKLTRNRQQISFKQKAANVKIKKQKTKRQILIKIKYYKIQLQMLFAFTRNYLEI